MLDKIQQYTFLIKDTKKLLPDHSLSCIFSDAQASQDFIATTDQVIISIYSRNTCIQARDLCQLQAAARHFFLLPDKRQL